MGAPKGEELEAALREAIESALQLLIAHGPFALTIERYLERDPHPGGQEAFIVRIQFPWYPSQLCRIKIEITHDEPVLLAPALRPLIHGYEETLDTQISCYRLEEIVVEKMRSLLQTHQKLIARGWNRPRARDYYDLWRILSAFGDSLERGQLMEMLKQKSVHRQVTFSSLGDFFTEELLNETRTHWGRSLGPFVTDLPGCEEAIEDLKLRVPIFFPDLSSPSAGRE